jgi:hypothetical protein
MAKVKRLGPLNSIADCINALGKIARTMWAGQIPTADGHRTASVVTMVRQAIEGNKLEELEKRLQQLEDGNAKPGA